MTGSNLSNDPFGCRLPSCNDYSSPPAKKDKKDPPKKDPPAKKPAAGPPCAAPVLQYYSYNCFYPQPQFCMVVQPPVAPAKPKKEKKPDPPAHVCVKCSAKNKCKACKKKEEESKKWVYNPTFSNPRTPRKGVFSK